MKRFGLIPFLLVAVAAPVLAADSVDNGFVPVGENLVVEGVPKIPATLAEAVRPYTEFRGGMIGSWHPVERAMLIATDFGNTMQIHKVKSPGGARTQLTFFREPVWQASYQPTKGDYFVYAKDTGGNENFQKYRFDDRKRSTAQRCLPMAFRETPTAYGQTPAIVWCTARRAAPEMTSTSGSLTRTIRNPTNCL